MSECDREASIMRKLWPTQGCYAMEKGIEPYTYVGGGIYDESNEHPSLLYSKSIGKAVP